MEGAPQAPSSPCRDIVFVGNPAYPSFFMRGVQMADRLRRAGLSARTASSVAGVRDSIVVVVKLLEPVAAAKRNRNVVVLDVIDGLCSNIAKALAGAARHLDAIFVPNVPARDRVRQLVGRSVPVHVVAHHWDPRLAEGSRTDRLCIGYVGDYGSLRAGLEHAGPLVRQHGVRLFDTNAGKDRTEEFKRAERSSTPAFDNSSMTRLGDDLREINMHMNVRVPGSAQALFKPGVKISTAAAMGANIITTRDASAMELLPADYPYLLRDSKLETVAAMIRHAEATFGGETWHMGLAQMAAVKDATSIERIADQYVTIFENLSAAIPVASSPAAAAGTPSVVSPPPPSSAVSIPPDVPIPCDVSTFADASAVATPSDASAVAIPSDASAVATPSDASAVATPSDAPAVSTPPDIPTPCSVPTLADASAVSTSSDASAVPTPSAVPIPPAASAVPIPWDVTVPTPPDASAVRAEAEGVIDTRYAQKCAAPRSDIGEHLPTLRRYAMLCDSIAEFGVRSVVSTWALLKGLKDGTGTSAGPKSLLSVDLVRSASIAEVERIARDARIAFRFEAKNDLEVDLGEGVDMLFIDTWHVYGHLKRELAAHAHRVRRYIALHDTEVDAVRGESLRLRMNVKEQSQSTGLPVEEITRGLRPAVEEFVKDGDAAGNRWRIAMHYTNCNGLTILERIP